MSHHTSGQGVSKLTAAASAAVNSNGGAVGADGGGGSNDSGTGGIGTSSNASLVYIPPPRQLMFASVQRRRTNTLLGSSALIRPMSRQLELDNATLLDSATRARVSHLSSSSGSNNHVYWKRKSFANLDHVGERIREDAIHTLPLLIIFLLGSSLSCFFLESFSTGAIGIRYFSPMVFPLYITPETNVSSHSDNWLIFSNRILTDKETTPGVRIKPELRGSESCCLLLKYFRVVMRATTYISLQHHNELYSLLPFMYESSHWFVFPRWLMAAHFTPVLACSHICHSR